MPTHISDTKGVTNPDIVDAERTLAEEARYAASYSSDEEKTTGGTTTPVNVLVTEATTDTDLINKYYEPSDRYESKHRWDPKATWTPEEEKRITRKLDLKVTGFACLCFAALNLDRYNIGSALSDNMLDDLGMNTGQYNIGQTLYFTIFLFAELPSQMISKKLGSDVWIPIQMMAWSLVSIAQMGIQNAGGFYATRALLGLIEGGFIADTILYLSYYYTANELTIRLSFFWVALTGTNIIGSFLATGILQLRHHTSLAGWRWLFMIEGALTFLIGLWAYFYMPASPTQTKTRWRKKPWFTEREEVIIVNKVLRDDPTKADMHNREGLSLDAFWRSLCDYDLWALYGYALLHYIPGAAVGAYFTLTLRSLGYSTFDTNLLTIPSSVLTIIFNLSLAFLTKKFNQRLTVASISSWWNVIFFIVLVNLGDDTSKWIKWAILTLIVGAPYAHPIMVSMNSMNAGSVRTRTVASSLYNMFTQASTLIASNVYQPSDAPYYHKGNRALLGIAVADLVIIFLAKGYYIWRNRQRSKIWDSYTIEQKDEYYRTTKDQGNKRLDFVFKH